MDFYSKKILFHVSSNCVSGELFENVRTTQKVGIIEGLFFVGKSIFLLLGKETRVGGYCDI